MPANNIDEVLVSLDQILSDTTARGSRLSLFGFAIGHGLG